MDRAARRIACIVTCAALAASACLPGRSAELIAGSPFERRHVQDSLGRDVTYYLSQPKGARAPLLLMIQGSGCGQVIVERPGAQTYSTVFGLMPFGGEGRYAVMAVEKPHGSEGNAVSRGSAQGCSEKFNEDFTAESWLVALEAALNDARREPWIDKHRALVLGTSEGGVMASLLASHDPLVTDVAIIGASGTTQLFDFIEDAYRHCFDASLCLEDLDKKVAAIHADPSSATKLAWGHPYKRWTSFFAVDPAEELLKGKARVYWALGTDDRNVPPASGEVAIAKLMAAGRDITLRRVPNAGHNLLPQGSRDWEALDKEMRAILAWFDRAK